MASLASASELIEIATAIGPFAVNWIKDAIKRIPTTIKYAIELGKDSAVPFIYVYYHLKTFKGFDREEFEKIFRSNPANKGASDEEVQNIFDKLKFISNQLNKAFLARKTEDELSEQELRRFYLIPKDEQGRRDMTKLLDYIGRTSGNFAKMNVPIMQLLFIPGATTLGEKLGMPEKELKQQSSFSQMFSATVSAIGVATKTPEQQAELEKLRNLSEKLETGETNAVQGISALALQQYAARSAATGDKQGLEYAQRVLSSIDAQQVPENVQSAAIYEESLPKLEDRKKVLYKGITNDKVRDWVRALCMNINDDSVIDLPAFMAPDQPSAEGDAVCSINMFEKPQAKTLQPIQGGNDNDCRCMSPRMVALIIVGVIILAIIASLPRYLIAGLLILLAAWLVWDN